MEELLKIINSVKEANKSKDSKSLNAFDNQRGGGGPGSGRKPGSLNKLPKKRGRPPGSLNKPKTLIVTKNSKNKSDYIDNSSDSDMDSESNDMDSSDLDYKDLNFKKLDNELENTLRRSSRKMKVKESDDDRENKILNLKESDISEDLTKDDEINTESETSSVINRSKKRNIQESEDSDREGVDDSLEDLTKDDEIYLESDESDDSSNISSDLFDNIRKEVFKGVSNLSTVKSHNVDYKSKEKIFINDKFVEYLKNSTIKDPKALILEETELNTIKALRKFDPVIKIVIPQSNKETSMDIQKALQKEPDTLLQENIEHYPNQDLDSEFVKDLFIDRITKKVKMPDTLFMDFTTTFWGKVKKTIYTMLERNDNPEIILSFTVSFNRQEKYKSEKFKNHKISSYYNDIYNIMENIVENCSAYLWKIDKFQVYKYHRTTSIGGKTADMIFFILDLNKSKINFRDFRDLEKLNNNWLINPKSIIGDVNEEVGTSTKPKLL